MARAGHVHVKRIVSHTTEATEHDVRVLLGCVCGVTETIRPHQGKKANPDFFHALQGYEHLCCNALPTDVARDIAA